jgi:hypothetical protein
MFLQPALCGEQMHILGPCNALIRAASPEWIVVSGDHDHWEAESSEAVCDPSASVRGYVLVLPEVTADRHGVNVVRLCEAQAPIECVAQVAAALTGNVGTHPDERPVEVDIGYVKDLYGHVLGRPRYWEWSTYLNNVPRSLAARFRAGTEVALKSQLAPRLSASWQPIGAESGIPPYRWRSEWPAHHARASTYMRAVSHTLGRTRAKGGLAAVRRARRLQTARNVYQGSQT